ncbi:MAG: hypothetical protein D6687_09760 [Acidobacteria bacterium]|jgi:hypothetical protein|nr:MAG: hypothetical protein D6687_09760 [Acidobacteriota bacterium]GIU81252.1 MAG: hypothetical protein KatS3mg006_0316 [Pyrinomonadaceae bacterium]
MKVYLLNVVLLAFCFALFADKSTAQNRVKFSFEVDAKPTKEKFKVLLYVDGAIIEPEMCDSSFIVPLEIQRHEFVSVRFVSDKYDLYFDEVPVNSFKSDWEIGVDYKPFETENINPERSYEKVTYIYYLKFGRFVIIVEVNEVNKDESPKK